MTQPSVSSAREQLMAAVSRGVTYRFAPPVPAEAGASLRQSAVLILFGELDAVPGQAPVPGTVHTALDVLLTRRSDTMRYHPGQIAFPGGGFEPVDANAAATALREAVEETGLDPSGVEILGELPPYFVTVSNNMVTPVIGWWRESSAVAAADSESLEVFRVPVTELLNPAARGTSVIRFADSRTDRVTVFRADAFRIGAQFSHRIVWGFTGIVLSALFDELGWASPWDRSHEFELPPRTT